MALGTAVAPSRRGQPARWAIRGLVLLVALVPACGSAGRAGVPPGSGVGTTGGATSTAPALVVTGTGWEASGLLGPQAPPGSCHARTAADGYALPDPTCTPGARNGAVTEGALAATICRRGFSSSVRPPVELTEPAKYRSMAAYGDRGPASGYEYDHLVPLELGGSSDTRNLWPEPDQGSPGRFDARDPYGRNAKDGVEDRLAAAVCAGQVPLAAAQEAIARDWTTAESTLGIGP
jgi:hypothetical protein